MARPIYVAGAFVVALGLAMPAASWAQASRRGGGSSGASSSGGSSSGGTAQAAPPPAPTPAPAPAPRAHSRSSQPQSSGPTESSGRARPRSGSAPIVTGSNARVVGSGGARTGATVPGGVIVGERARERGGRALQGYAVRRGSVEPGGGGGGVSFPLYGPWGSWYPWYSSGFGWNLGFVTYDPWAFGGTEWGWGRYGLWYDPFSYYPYSPYSPYYTTSLASGLEDRVERDTHPTGSVRLRVNPKEAKVYVDGALVGVVDEFDGLSHHLDLQPGRHEIEVRADGYQPLTLDVQVQEGRTTTARGSLKKD